MAVNTVKKFIVKNKLIEKGDFIVVLNSFGKDSSVLTHILNQLKKDIGFELKCLNIQYAKHIFADKKEINGIIQFWKDQGVDIETIEIPSRITDANDVGKYKTPCTKCKVVRRHFIKEWTEECLKTHDKIKIATGHNYWNLIGYSFVVMLETNFFSENPKKGDYVFEVLGRFYPKTDFGRIQLIRPLLPLSDIEIHRYLFDHTNIERLQTTCDFRQERPKRKIAKSLEAIDLQGELDVSYEGCMNFIERWGLFDRYKTQIKKLPWDVFVV